jgi:hypothetical protein
LRGKKQIFLISGILPGRLGAITIRSSKNTGREFFRDIYNDMLKGIAEFEAGYPKDAAFTWRLLQWSHWGFHVVDAVRALHYLKWS